ncbi:hypothetical protein [Kitasatospora sp. McL0602]|uniref:hypothetical protein n=1 Tax=Kitasatospora sp. McL0602 TaxID=3439530 RepID=UPI003F8A4244
MDQVRQHPPPGRARPAPGGAMGAMGAMGAVGAVGAAGRRRRLVMGVVMSQALPTRPCRRTPPSPAQPSPDRFSPAADLRRHPKLTRLAGKLTGIPG